MTRRVYRTAQGKKVDLGALELQNENVRAVGNMNVNAKGDIIDAQNKVVETKSENVKKHYKKQYRTNVSDDTIPESKAKTKKQTQLKIAETMTIAEPKIVAEPVTQKEEIFEPVAVTPTPKKSEKIPEFGLAGAIAKAKQVTQEPMKTPRQMSKEKQGVKKI